MQKRALIDEIAPWLIWTAFFLTLAAVGTKSSKIGASTSNPRSLNQAAITSPTPPKPSAPDCRGESLIGKEVAREKK